MTLAPSSLQWAGAAGSATGITPTSSCATAAPTASSAPAPTLDPKQFPRIKLLGWNRGKPRLYFQSAHLASIGFAPGTAYDAEVLHLDRDHSGPDPKFDYVLRLNALGRPVPGLDDLMGTRPLRRVVGKTVRGRLLSIIDINTTSHLGQWAEDVREVEVDYSPGLIEIRALWPERAEYLKAGGAA